MAVSVARTASQCQFTGRKQRICSESQGVEKTEKLMQKSEKSGNEKIAIPENI